MVIKINHDIVNEDQKELHYWLTGAEGVSYKDIDDAIAQKPADDNVIRLQIYSCGGSCVDGFAIYDRVRATGCEIHTEVIGQASSMATVIMMAAPKERRTAYPNAQFMIHAPYYPSAYGELNYDTLMNLAESIKSDEDRIVAIYTERTGMDEDTIREQMKKGTDFGVDKALELGFIGSVIEPNTASANKPKISYGKMNTNTDKNAIASAFDALKQALGFGSETTDPALAAKEAEIVALKEQIAGFTAEKETLAAKVTDLEAKVAAASTKEQELAEKVTSLEAQAKTEEEIAMLNTIAEAGGKEWLDKVSSSNYTPDHRQQAQGQQTEQQQHEELMNRKVGE